MAGLFSRVDEGGLDGDGNNRINVSLLADLVIQLAARKKPFDTGTLAQKKQALRDIVNAILDEENAGDALDTTEENHVEQVIDKIEGFLTNTDKLVYVVGALKPSLNLAELGQISESDFNSNLGIV